ncbi:MAG: glutamate formimidoyltransferase [Bacteroidota bacterium]|nr:glutamate formimidoyltransferase [Bacteroidota bacterium]
MIPDRILECVPNFSEGRDLDKINAIAAEIEGVEGVKLLHVDPGYDANRTVMTFAGVPEAVVDAAFRAVKKASEVIDMRLHKGVHPRFGATDVLPLVPVRGVLMDETVSFARNLGQRIGEELGIHVFCYEFAAFEEKRRNLANCRAGEYEGLPEKLSDPQWKPDYGPMTFNTQSGAVAVGARNFLVAYNINLDTNDVKIAQKIAVEIRESGRWVTSQNISGEIQKKHLPGLLKGVKAIGWYMPNYRRVQVSTNIIDIDKAPVHLVYEEVKKRASFYGIPVTGSELIGLVPLSVMVNAAEFYFPGEAGKKEITKLLERVSDELGLSDLFPFQLQERVLEFAIGY